ncbi:nucleotide-binding protein [bacterium]|nr:nucleotide-binding protein [bacterium]
MMKKKKAYRHICFFADTIKEASKLFDLKIKEDVIDLARKLTSDPKKSDDEILDKDMSISMRVQIDEEEWDHDSEDEFFADYRKDPSNSVYTKSLYGNEFIIQTIDHSSYITIGCKSRSKIESIFYVFEENIDPLKCTKIESKKITKPAVFIGHGRSPLWRDLKDHLQDKHYYKIEAYEVGARAGHAVRDVLENMLVQSSFALLVLTGEDETYDGRFHARQNVIHETGLFQGRLGFSKAIVLLEEGAEVFSNIHGIEQIRFSKGNIKETFGEVLATIKREYP